jgi:hypothetical protein
MDSVTILKEIRRRVGDVDGIIDSANQDASDEVWFEYVDSAVNFLDANSITTTTYVVSGTSISPEPTTLDGLMLASWSVYTYLLGDLARRVRNGELGIKFKTGQDEISTVEAAKKIESAAAQAEREFRHLVNMRVADKTGKAARVQ